ncbi:mannitol dehydrogenase family protein [Nocardioides houyundeii]|uniref:mannitol dehydrogenase family protein n=1 Tax=Nocardioides houyundeii TaxID=2045452 RepID=UPI000C76B6F8|nr:mannitol dehydrogenase family protein [Nocardioides houyundeii]
MDLCDKTLPALHPLLATPSYDRAALRRSIVHIGVGAFHRAHQLVYLDALARGGNSEWGETGVGLVSDSMKGALLPQDRLYTVVERASGHEAATVVGAMSDYLFAPDDPRAVLGRLAHAETRIVTLTITGDGYNLDANGDFDDSGATVRAEALRLERPTTWFGFLVAALARRRTAGLGGFTVLSCDNLANSGAAAESAVVGFAQMVDHTLARWIRRHVSFPNGMVDRITPVPGTAAPQLVSQRFGLVDRAPVLTEPFRQWVIEDSFAAGRPPLEDVGVELVADVAPHKLMKSRLLNGTHSAMAYLGHLAGHRTTAQMAADPIMRDYLARLMRDEIAPLLPPIPGVDLGTYRSTVLDRLGNENISDDLSRLAARGSTKVPAYLLPSLVESRRAGVPNPLLILAVAAWFRYLRGHDLAGEPIDVADVRRDELVPLALAGGTDPGPLLGLRSVMGSLGDDLWVRSEISRALRDLERLGVHGAVRMRLSASRDAVLRPRLSDEKEGSRIS